MQLENQHFALRIDPATGAIASLVARALPGDLIGEPRLCANFRLCVPLPYYQCNYIEGMEHTPQAVTRSGDEVTVRFAGMTSTKGKYPIDLEYTISLVDDTIRFRARLTNRSSLPVSEFWFPRLGGWTRFGAGRDAKVAVPEYWFCRHESAIFKQFPGGQGLGAPASEWWTDYPGRMQMPWIDLYDSQADIGLYFGYHDPTMRVSTWHHELHPRDAGWPTAGWLTPEEAGGEPAGLVFSHVRYPFVQNGETLDTGEFILRVHRGDWHHGSRFYREWFLKHFPFDKSKSWLRKQSAWFSSIIYQPEDRLLADYPTFDQWCKEAEQFGIDTHELIGWDKGGLERDYPEYVPEPKLGGKEGLRNLLRSVDARGKHCLLFVNYNILDQNTDWYKRELHQYTHQDLFGTTPNWMTWGESTLLARKGYARKHVLASIVPPLEKILEKFLLELVRDGAQGFQIDKICVNQLLDFNPLNTRKPDVALCEGLVQAMDRLLARCRAINPNFCIAAEAAHDRLIPYIDVFYRTTAGYDISPLKFVFPEWTSCQHIAGPRMFRGVNASVLTGSVIVVEPFTYQGSLGHPLYRKLGEYIREVERIRHELAELIFLGNYFDTLDATVTPVTATSWSGTQQRTGGEVIVPGGGAATGTSANGPLIYRVHGHRETDRRAITVANDSDAAIDYHWNFLHRSVERVTVYEPFQPVKTVDRIQPLRIGPEGLQVLVEEV